jgi:hypothetical protein
MLNVFIASLIVLCSLTVVGAQNITCDPNCSGKCVLRGDGKCDKTCIKGYGVDFTTWTCGPCEPLCNGSCNIAGSGTCDMYCVAGSGINKLTRHCEQCARACVKTDTCNRCGAGTCDNQCISGYSLKNCSCVLCDLHCSECRINGYLRCDPGKCHNLYALDEKYNTCAPCDTNCGTNCTKPGTCAVGGCKPGYGDLASGTDNICAPLPPPIVCARNCTSGCAVESAGFCDSSCAFGTAWSPAVNDPTGTKHACYTCAIHCTSGCTRKGCCDSPYTCAVGTPGISPTDPTCHVCL